MPLRRGAYASITVDGRIVHGSPAVQKQLGYVVETDEGQQTLTPTQFRQAYGQH